MSDRIDYDHYAPIFKVKISGQTLSPTAVISVSVDQKIDAPDKFDIQLNEGFDINSQKFNWLDNDLIHPGKVVDVFIGYAGKQMRCLIKGTINAISPDFPSTGVPSLKIEGYDFSQKLQNRMNKYNSVKVSYSDVVRQLAGKNKLSAGGVESSGKKYEKIDRRKDESDYKLIERLAGEMNFEFFVREKKLYFRKAKENKKVQTYQYKKDLISFTPRLSTASIVTQVEVSGWNEKEKKGVEGKATLSDVTKDSSVKRIITKFVTGAQGNQPRKKEVKVQVDTAEEATKRAKFELTKLARKFIEGSIDCIGDPELIPGVSVEIKGIGDLFSGKYYITGAKHSLSGSGYKTTLDVRRVL